MKIKAEIWELILTFLFIIACHTTKFLQPMLLPVFDKEGHRGCRGLMPENTIPAMLRAIDLGVSTLEMDVVITKDEQVIVSHEPFFNHEITTKPDGTFIEEKEEKNYNIFSMTYAETRNYDVGSRPNPRFPRQQKFAVQKPLLADLIDSVQNYCKIKNVPLPFFNIETKTHRETDNLFHPRPEKFVALLMKTINKKGITEKVIIQSFDFRTLQVLNRQYPSIKTAALIEGDDKRPLEDQLKEVGFIPFIYSPEVSLVNEQLLKKCHQQNIKVIPWTINEKSKIEELKKMGVDGVITDYPDLFQV